MGLQFSPRVRQALGEGGWTPERRVEVSPWIGTLQREGFPDPPGIARAVLESLGGLALRLVYEPTMEYDPGFLDFDPVRAASGELDRVKLWEEIAELALYPVGEWRSGVPSVLLVSGSGALLAGSMGQLTLLGHSVEDGIDLIVSARGRGIRIDGGNKPMA